MVPGMAFRVSDTSSSPRSGGDGPQPTATALPHMRFSPLRRGWSDRERHEEGHKVVLPAQAGMVPLGLVGCPYLRSSPRSGGDGPSWVSSWWTRRVFSPLRRGWSGDTGAAGAVGPVLPAQAGMVRSVARRCRLLRRSPRSGGDGPKSKDELIALVGFSPLRRGWSLSFLKMVGSCQVLPAQAGMVPLLSQNGGVMSSSPRSGGDGPDYVRGAGIEVEFSPLRRGWSQQPSPHQQKPWVLPAQAGMVPRHDSPRVSARRSPRSGGDGPVTNMNYMFWNWFSPLRRGWSALSRRRWPTWGVLPAQAGMVPAPACRGIRRSCSPRSGGDGPEKHAHAETRTAFSPLRRGWSHTSQIQAHARSSSILLHEDSTEKGQFAPDQHPHFP